MSKQDFLFTSFSKQKCYRLTPSKFPPIALFEDVADPADFEASYAIQELTNPRIRQELGNLDLVPKRVRIYNIKGAGYIMAAFTHVNPEGSRFSDGTFGVYYAANELTTAIHETVYHREIFLRATNLPPQEIDMRCLVGHFTANLIDITNKELYASVYSKEHYHHSQPFGNAIKISQHDGLYYHSVRTDSGKNFALLKPRLFHECIQQAHYGYIWNGQKITDVYKKEVVIF